MKNLVVTGGGMSGCCFLVVLAFNCLLGGFCADYLLWACFNIDIPWYADVLIGLVGGEFIVPAAIIAWTLHFAIPIPFFPVHK
jgi:hypothetical protein